MSTRPLSPMKNTASLRLRRSSGTATVALLLLGASAAQAQTVNPRPSTPDLERVIVTVPGADDGNKASGKDSKGTVIVPVLGSTTGAPVSTASTGGTTSAANTGTTTVSRRPRRPRRRRRRRRTTTPRPLPAAGCCRRGR